MVSLAPVWLVFGLADKGASSSLLLSFSLPSPQTPLAPPSRLSPLFTPFFFPSASLFSPLSSSSLFYFLSSFPSLRPIFEDRYDFSNQKLRKFSNSLLSNLRKPFDGSMSDIVEITLNVFDNLESLSVSRRTTCYERC